VAEKFISTSTDYTSVIVLPIAIGIIGLNGCYIGIIPEPIAIGSVGLLCKYNWYKLIREPENEKRLSSKNGRQPFDK
jgi:hypothetical protein